MKKRVHYKWTHNLQPGTKCTKVFPALKIGYAMTWKHGITLYLIKTALHVVKGPQGIVLGNKVRDTSTSIS